jgi:hypothetical protein
MYVSVFVFHNLSTLETVYLVEDINHFENYTKFNTESRI